MKFDQLIEPNMRNNFIEISYTKRGGKFSQDHFIKKIKIEHISGSTV